MTTTSQSIPIILNQFMQTAQQSLLHVITSLQSDQLLQQMRNDQNLYQQKMNYINEMIRQHFVLQPVNELLLKEIQMLKQTQAELESRLEQSREEYISELSNIEVQYNQFLAEKQSEKRLMENTIQEKNHEIFMLNKDFNIKTKDLQMHNENLQKQLDTVKNTLISTKAELEQSIRQNSSMKKQFSTLKKQQDEHQEQKKSKTSQLAQQYTALQQQNFQLNNKLTQLEQLLKNASQSQQSYIQTIERMKDDMFLIKDQWQKRCDQIQRDLTDDYRSKLSAQQEEMKEKLNLYVEQLKMGKNVIIESSQQILQSKKQLMQERFDMEIKRCEQEIHQLQEQLQEQKIKGKDLLTQIKTLSQKLTTKDQEIKQVQQKYQNDIKTKESLIKLKQQQLQQRLAITKHQTDKQIDRLRKTQNMLLKDLKTSKLEKQQINKQVQSLKEQFNNYKEKQLKQTKRLKELEQLNESSTTKILQLKKDLAIMGEKSSIDERTLKDKNNQIARLENNLTQTKHQYKEMDTVARRLQLKISELNLKHKENQRIKAQAIHKLQKLYLIVRKLSKQLTLVKQDITFQLNLFKPQLQTIIITVNDQILARQETIKLSHKQKLRDLLDQFEEQRRQQRDQQEQLIRENQNMKKQTKLMEQILRQKQQDYLYHKERTVNLEVEKCRLMMQEEITKEREQKRKLQDKLYQQEKRFEYNMTKSEKQVMKQVGSFMAKWEHKIAQTQQLLVVKDKTIKELTSQLKKISTEHESTMHELHETQQKLQKHQHKYQSLKQQRDKTIQQLMKRLEKQTRHKLALQKQLKQIRGQIMKTQANTNTSSPFNNYSFTDRQNANVYTNAFQTATQDRVKTHIKQTNREKELSQIREMIAKTYKVVETGPEKDEIGYKGRLF